MPLGTEALDAHFTGSGEVQLAESFGFHVTKAHRAATGEEEEGSDRKPGSGSDAFFFF